VFGLHGCSAVVVKIDTCHHFQIQHAHGPCDSFVNLANILPCSPPIAAIVNTSQYCGLFKEYDRPGKRQPIIGPPSRVCLHTCIRDGTTGLKRKGGPRRILLLFIVLNSSVTGLDIETSRGLREPSRIYKVRDYYRFTLINITR
jgi:hypothetical protein